MTNEEAMRAMSLLGAKDGDVVFVDRETIDLVAFVKHATPDMPAVTLIPIYCSPGQSVKDAFYVMPKEEAEKVLNSLIAIEPK